MVSTDPYEHRVKLILTVVFILSVACLPLESVGVSSGNQENLGFEAWKKSVLGSRPPTCINRCQNCKPCRAVLVIPPHSEVSLRALVYQKDENYYLLSWKCKCRNKYFPS